MTDIRRQRVRTCNSSFLFRIIQPIQLRSDARADITADIDSRLQQLARGNAKVGKQSPQQQTNVAYATWPLCPTWRLRIALAVMDEQGRNNLCCFRLEAKFFEQFEEALIAFINRDFESSETNGPSKRQQSDFADGSQCHLAHPLALIALNQICDSAQCTRRERQLLSETYTNGEHLLGLVPGRGQKMVSRGTSSTEAPLISRDRISSFHFAEEDSPSLGVSSGS
ncbi:hypothetical protein BAUCODRAFT_480166 [Baudoinia panamericana UAMH 10762]|uniref:Uncharacterized protein n=1 Tax=Baudoinia panamericana (strain UAMH 10762) TaxID=717646 RepID=M2NBM3_BAUPA|nr:uncharacterized protein BAUCODRAFT_480166 [Baudoinia panamericana UAMH 10762]EMC96544.1 hypothetical protein BAUCODRAFT_480166 [Baudoinia panamericana UAMH 10762]